MKLFCTILGIVIALCSTPSLADDLIDVFGEALKSDPELLAESAAQSAVQELDKQALARFLPQINLSANDGLVRREASAQTFGGDVEYNSHGYSIDLTQPVFRRQNFIQSNQADIAIERAQANYQIVQQALIVRVAERYFDLLAGQDNLSFAIAEKAANAKQLEQVQQRFDLGSATITDLTESQASYDFAHASLISAENELANSKERLRETAGSYYDYLAVLKQDTPLVLPQPLDSNQWAEMALRENPSLVAAQKVKEDAQQNIALQKSDHYPSLDIVGQKSFASQSDSSFGGSSKTHQDTLSLQFNMPIFEGGDVLSRTRQAQYQLDQAMQNEERERRAILRQSREAFNGVVSGVSRVKALKQLLVSSEKALESTEAGYEVGTRTLVDVVSARRDLFGVKRDYAQSRYDYILSSLRLKQAAGIIQASDLADINQWLQTSDDS